MMVCSFGISSFRVVHCHSTPHRRRLSASSCWLLFATALTGPLRTVSCLARSFVLPSIRSSPKKSSASSLPLAVGSSCIATCITTPKTFGSALFSSTTTTLTTTSFSSNTDTDKQKVNKSIMDAPTKLAKLRERMKELGYDVYLIPTDDPHLSEYVPDAYKRREFLTEFRGSAGTAVVTQEEAYVWTDSRYWNEANLQLDPSIWKMQKVGLPDTPTIPKWLAETATEFWKNTDRKSPMKIAMDPYVHPASFAKEVQEEMEKLMHDEDVVLEEDAKKEEGSSNAIMPGQLVPEYTNLIDEIWGTDRPAIPTSPFRIHPMEYAGASVETKVAQIRKEMQNKKATIAVFSTLDDVAYLCNLRAQGDIDTCPVGIGYAIVTLDNIFLYCDPAKSVNIGEYLQASNITHKPYDQIVSDLQTWTANDPKAKVWMDKSRTNYAIVNVIPEKQLIDAQNAITPMKAVKNSAELAGMREAHIVDGVAMAHFMAWLEEQIVTVGRSVSEVEIDLVLTQYRAQQPGFVECSFPTIAGVGSNGAIIHYRASEDNPALLKHLDRQTSLLLDSGGQYLYGTTDVTRTWSFQESPDPTFCDYYTRVLKGNIGLDQMIFPENTPGFVLDTYARRWLWDIQADYGHGTGHGVGAALNVHEGPMSISPRWANKEVLKPGMVISNEPGYYEDGNFGIRIENLIEVAYVNPEDATPEDVNAAEEPKSSKKKFFRFHKLTMIPIQKNLINLDLMTEEELDWLDAYHAEVLEKVGSRLEEGSPAMEWLKKSCQKVDRTRTS